MTNAVGIAQSGANNVTMRNRIINGGMQVNQRGGTISASGTANTYGVDRFAMRTTSGSVVASMQQSTIAPSGFYNSLLCTVTTADASLAFDDLTCLFQRIEGVNVADLGWGTSSAQAVTLSFWVRSNLTGTYGVGVQNNDGNRSYPSTYTISTANTWEYKNITIPGDTSGTWNLGTTSTALYVFFGLSAGSGYTGGTTNAWSATDSRGASGQVNWGATLSNTFYITGVQLEKGTTATPFEQRLYGTELALCQRYYWKNQALQAYAGFGTGIMYNTTAAQGIVNYPVPMRAAPSFSFSTLRIQKATGTATVSAIAVAYQASNGSEVEFTVGSGLSAGDPFWIGAAGSTSAYLDASAEL